MTEPVRKIAEFNIYVFQRRKMLDSCEWDFTFYLKRRIVTKFVFHGLFIAELMKELN